MRKTPKEVYQEYKRNGCGSFAEWLGIRKPEIRRGHNGKFICSKFVRYKYTSEFICGEPCDTAKLAKASYKKSLLEFHAAMREYEKSWRNE